MISFSNSQFPGSQPYRILIVGDSDTSAQLLAATFQGCYDIQVAISGPQALDILRSGNPLPDLILLDVVMPGMDGFEVWRQIKSHSRTKAVSIIFVTCMKEPLDEEYGLKLGAVDSIAKPFHAAIVRARVQTHLELKRRTDELEPISMLDGLMQIHNRRYLDERLQQEWGQVVRQGTP